jgi:hypothetical protein
MNNKQNMKRIIVILLLAACCASTFAQYEKKHINYLQFSLGADVYSGEIGGIATGKGILNQWNFASTRPLVSLGYKHALNGRWSLKGFVSAMQLAGNTNSIDVKYRPAYHRWFETNMLEVGGNVELNVINNYDFTNQAYVFLGTGATLAVKPKLHTSDVLVRTRDEKGNFSPSPAPFLNAGFGYQHNFERWSLGAEIFGQYHFTDFLDGVKFLKSDINDMLIGLNFTFSYKLRSPKVCNCDW